MPRYTRRRLLQAGGLAGLSATAGCLGIFGGGGNGSSNTSPSGGDGSDGGDGDSGGGNSNGSSPQIDSYLEWLPAPQQFQGDDRYSYNYFDVAGFRKHEDVVHEDTYRPVETIAGQTRKTLGATQGSIGAVAQVGTQGTKLVTGQFDPGSIGGNLQNRTFEKRDPYQGYDLYRRGGKEPKAVAVSESAALVCRRSGTNEPLAIARMLIDTQRGKLERFAGANEDFWAAAQPVAEADRAGVSLVREKDSAKPARGQFTGNTAFGFGFTVGKETTETLFVVVFENAEVANPDAVRTWANEGLKGFQQYDDYGVQQDGRIVTISGTIPTEKFDFLTNGDPGGEELD